jgi:NTE family protein
MTVVDPDGVDSDLLEPVRQLPIDKGRPVEDTVALSLSGGGYRAMLFHTGVLRRLNDVGFLPRLNRVSSVSGGSIAAGVLALAWKDLHFDDTGSSTRFVELVEKPVRALAGRTLDLSSAVEGLVMPWQSISDRLTAAYREHLFGKATLQQLPEAPVFVINATNVGSGALVRFTRAYLADWRVGRIDAPEIELARAVAASSAFPPVLSPSRLDLKDAAWVDEEGNDLATAEQRDELVLTDGGVYDNLGIETAWKRCRTILVSDGGGQMGPDEDPAGDWARHMVRVVKVIDNQVRVLRKRQVIEGFKRGDRSGAYLGIRSQIEDFHLPDSLPAPPEQTLRLAEIPTRLASIRAGDQERLINWGYAICDTALRRHVIPDAEKPEGFPYPNSAVG